MKNPCYILFIILVSCLDVPGQIKELDSLKFVLKGESNDTNKVKTLNTLSRKLEDIHKYDSSLACADRAYTLAEQLDFKTGMMSAYRHMAYVYDDQSNYLKAIQYNSNALDIAQEVKDKHAIATILGNIGPIYYEMGDFQKALDYFSKALPLAQETQDTTIIDNDIANIALIYSKLAKYPEALNYFLKALAMAKRMHENEDVAYILCNIASDYVNQKEYSKALDYDLQALEFAEKTDDKSITFIIVGNMGLIYQKKGNLSEAFNYFSKALAMAQGEGDKSNISIILGNIGSTYFQQKNYKQAKIYLDSSLHIAMVIGQKDNIQTVYNSLASLDSATGNYKSAFEDYKQFTEYSDSILNDANKQKMETAMLTAAFKSSTDSAKITQGNLNAIAEKEKQRQRLILNSFIGGFVLMLALAFFIFRGYRQKQKANTIITQQKEEVEKQKEEVEHQKALVEEKNKDILDSITYAKRLQEAIMPPISLLHQFFPQLFLFYRPKDIVAGDFYWMEQAGDNILIAAADCTGHGVPGALVSVICSTALNRTVKEFHITEPGKILDKVRELVLETFEKSEANVQDGMDISLCCINTKTNAIQWSGAYNSLWYIQNGEIYEVAADKQPIGKIDKPQPFHTHSLHLQKGDALYLLTDGYADQFGGPKGKKFKYKHLQDVLLANAAKSLEEQKNILQNTLEEWKGNLEQVDDILVIGIKI